MIDLETVTPESHSDSLTQTEETALNIMIDKIFDGSKNIAAQIPKDKIVILLEKVNKAIQKQKETYWPKPQSFKDIKRNLRYFFEHGFQKPEITNVKILDLASIMEKRQKDKTDSNLEVTTLSIDVIITLLSEFQIDLTEKDPNLLSIEKAIAEEKQTRGISKQTLIVTGLEKLPPQSQAMVAETLIEHLAGERTFNVVILHDEPITTYYERGGGFIGLHPDDHHLDGAPEWPKKAVEI